MINEAIEVAKAFGTEQSPKFINGVLDAIAKALDSDAANSGPVAPSLTTPAMTQAGMILGTAAYMSSYNFV